jgi:hypothetical protein
MAEHPRVQRGWIFINGSRQDDGHIALGKGGEMRLSPIDAWQERHDAQIPMSAIRQASVQRLAFWRR